MDKLVAVTIGDPKGIGIHILIDLWKKKQFNNFILFSDIKIIKNILNKYRITKNINFIDKISISNFNYKKLNIFTYKSKSTIHNTYQSLIHAYNFNKKNLCIGLITLPLRKDLIKQKINNKFIGHTEYFQNIENKKNSNMILYHNKIIVSPITTHIPVSKISKKILNKDFLFKQIFNLYNTLKVDFNINKPKIIISGFNPHAGEKGEIGTEEIKSIMPTLKKLRKYKINIEGPSSADSILIKRNLKKYNCFIFLYHDQALIPFKYISKFSGVNYTGNLSIIRTSPDHGTAYNLIGSKEISNKSLLNCYKLIKKIYRNRQMNVQS